MSRRLRELPICIDAVEEKDLQSFSCSLLKRMVRVLNNKKEGRSMTLRFGRESP